jgi:D-inositol-3-phosphate glycosyltransferase
VSERNDETKGLARGGGPPSRLTIIVDQPDGREFLARGDLLLSGHLEGVRDAQAARVLVQVGRSTPVTGVVTPDPSGPRSGCVKWSAHVDLSDVDPGPTLMTAMAHVHRETHVARRHLTVERSEGIRSGGSGYLDFPEDQSNIDGEVLLVRGWCLFEDSHVAEVEVFVDGTSVGRARLYVDQAVPTSLHKDAAVAGFEAFVDVRNLPKGKTSLVSVEATSLKGERWRPNSHTVTWAVEHSPESSDLANLRERNESAVAEIRSTRSNVVVFTHDLGYGGGQLWLLELLRELQRHEGMKCRVISLADGPLRVTLEDMDIPVHITSYSPMDSVFSYEGQVQELALLIKANNGGVVLVNTLTAFVAIDAAERAQVPSLWAIHESLDLRVYCYMAWGPTGMDPRVKDRMAANFQLPRGLIFEASKTAELFGEFRAPKPSYVVDYGVDIDEIDAYRNSVQRAELRASAGFDDTDKIVLVMGTTEPRKAQAAVVAAFDELSAVHDNLHLVLVGANSSHYSEALEVQIERTRNNSRIHVIPVTSDIYQWYELCDLFLCASDMESLPRSIIEAMAFELPVISTDIYGISELIDDGRTGWLTRDRDLEALVGLWHLVLQKPDSELKQIATAARAVAHERHGSQGYRDLIVRTLQGLLADQDFDPGTVLNSLGSVSNNE